QVDHVVSARLRLADGRLVEATREDGSDLLRFVLAGLGRLAVIESATMRTVPFRPVSRVEIRPRPSLESLADGFGWLSQLCPGDPRPDTACASFVVVHGAAVEQYGED